MITSLTKIYRLPVFLLLAIFLGLGACQKTTVTQYELEEIKLYSSASEKKNLKSDEQFISILYTDVFGKSISNDQLRNMNKAYASIGDKSLIIDIFIKSLLTDPAADLPSDTEMRADEQKFIEETYKRFLVRKPTGQEIWFLTNQIRKNPSLTALDIYYALLTSDEYRYY